MTWDNADVLGDAPAFDWTTLINAAAEAANRGVTYAQQKKAAEAASKTTAERVSAIVAADSASTAANAALAYAEALAARPGATMADRAKADAGRAVASNATLAQGIAASALTPEATFKRVEAATKAAREAAEGYQRAANAYAADSKNKGKEDAAIFASALAQSAQATAMKASSGQIAGLANVSPADQAAALAAIKARADAQTSWTRHFSILNVLIGLGVVGAGVGGYLILRRRK